MRALGKKALAEIARHDRAEGVFGENPNKTLEEIFRHGYDERGYDGVRYFARRFRNRTRFYKWLVLRGNDVEVHTVAVKTDTRSGRVAVKEVVRGSAASGTLEVRDVACYNIGGYVCDWSPEGLGRRHEWSYHGRWQTVEYRNDGLFGIRCATLNTGALERSRRFRYCAYTADCGDILKYLKHYAANPRIEWLSKAGMGRFARMTGFCRRLAGNRGLARFFSEHMEEIKRDRYGADAVGYAFKRRMGLAQAEEEIRMIRRFRGEGLPAAVDRLRAARYVSGLRGVDEWEYAQYAKRCARLGLDLADTKHAFPKDFDRASRRVRDRLEVLDRERERALREQQAAELLAKARAWKFLERVRSGKYVAVVPKSDADFLRESSEKALDNCLYTSNYGGKMARGQCVVVFVRARAERGKPLAAAEISPEGKVRQCYGRKNSRPTQDVLDFVEKVAAAVRTAARKMNKKPAAVTAA